MLSLYFAFSFSWQSVSGLVAAKFCTHLPPLHTHILAGTCFPLPMQEPNVFIHQSVEHDMQGHLLKQQISLNTLCAIEIERIKHVLECFAR